MKSLVAVLSLLLLVPLSCAQETVDHSTALKVIPWTMRYDFPGKCSPSQRMTLISGTWGSNDYVCGLTNNWVATASSGGASPAGNDGDVQVKAGTALGAAPMNCAGGNCTIGTRVLAQGSDGYVDPLLAVKAPNQNVIYASTSCGGATNCVTVKADTKWVSDATSTNTSQTVTCPNNDCNFVAGDVGKVVFGTADVLAGAVHVPIGTISAVNGAQSITVSVAATASHTANLVLVWGSDDTAALDTLSTTVGTACAMGIFPAGYMITKHGQFKSQSGCKGAGLSVYAGPAWRGQGINASWIIPTPDFDFTTCTGGVSTTACFFGTNAGELSSFTIWGGGALLGGTQAKNLVEIGNACRVTLVDFEGFAANTSSLVGLSWHSSSGVMYSGGVIQFGSTQFKAEANQTISIGNYYYGTFGPALQVGQGGIGTLMSIADYFQGCSASSYTTAVTTEAQFHNVFIAPNSGCTAINTTGGVVTLSDNSRINVLNASGVTGIVALSGAKVYMQNSTITGGSGASPLNTNSTGNLYDQGGMTFVATSGAIGANVVGPVFGSASITGTAFTTTGFALTSGWDTSTKTSASGNAQKLTYLITLAGTPTTGAVATVTFPNTFLVAPICTHSEGGTQLLTNVTLGTPSTTSVTVTYTGTLTAANTIQQVLSCSN